MINIKVLLLLFAAVTAKPSEYFAWAGTIPAKTSIFLSVPVEKNKYIMLTGQSDSGVGDIDCYLADTHHNVVDYDERQGTTCVLEYIPKEKGIFKLKISNRSDSEKKFDITGN